MALSIRPVHWVEMTTLPSVPQPSLYATELRNLSYRKIALAVARQLMGPTADFAGDHTIFKPIHKGGQTHEHQDEAEHARFHGAWKSTLEDLFPLRIGARRIMQIGAE